MCNLMARCITYFTMLVELLIIKNVNAVAVMLLTGHSECILHWSQILFNISLWHLLNLDKNKAWLPGQKHEPYLSTFNELFKMSVLSIFFL